MIRGIFLDTSTPDPTGTKALLRIGIPGREEMIMAAGEVSETLKVVYHPFVFGVAAGFCILTLTCLLDITRAFREDGEGAP